MTRRLSATGSVLANVCPSDEPHFAAFGCVFQGNYLAIAAFRIFGPPVIRKIPLDRKCLMMTLRLTDLWSVLTHAQRIDAEYDGQVAGDGQHRRNIIGRLTEEMIAGETGNHYGNQQE